MTHTRVGERTGVAVAALALGFSFWMLAGSGDQAAYYGMLGLMLGVPVYIRLKHGRGEYGEFPTPAVVTEKRAAS